jgi:hypothetical protein
MPMASASLYADLLRNSGAFAFGAPAFVGRTPMAMYSLGTVLLISARTGDYALAGTVAAAGFAGSAVVIPATAALADNLGQRRRNHAIPRSHGPSSLERAHRHCPRQAGAGLRPGIGER